MDIDVEFLNQQIPFYLTAENKRVLARELESIGAGETVNYFLTSYHNEFKDIMLQGDGWRGFQLYIFNINECRQVTGIVLSNSCDVNPENFDDLAARVTFAPLVKFSTYRDLLYSSHIERQRVEDKLAAIKAQKVSNIFYLPSGGPLGEEYIVRFDEIHSMPVSIHDMSSERKKLFTLNNTGFYMLVLKLSFHFCRLQENINRGRAST